jgi:hypothetical protein
LIRKIFAESFNVEVVHKEDQIQLRL